MKKSKTLAKKAIALLLVLVSIFSIGVTGMVGASAAATASASASVLSTFAGLLESGIKSGVSGGVTAALTPMISLIGQEVLGLPADSGLTEIRQRLDAIEGQLTELRSEMNEGFEKILAELDKKEKMENTINALAEAEFLASVVLNLSNADRFPATAQELAQLTGVQQQKLVEINAEAIRYEVVEALYMELLKAKAYLASGGYIDSNYETAYNVYYDYMKKQSMFCGEAAMKSEAFWAVMKESYAKSCLALIFALEQQLSMYALSESEPTDGITQQAIDAAAVATSFGTKSVLENKLASVKEDGAEVLRAYDEFLARVNDERTVFINKGTCYVPMKTELASICFDGSESYEKYISTEGFEKGGLTKELYERILADVKDYYFNNGDNYLEGDSVSFEEFISNTGACIRRDAQRDVDGTWFKKKDIEWNKVSPYTFTSLLMNMKVEKYNIANKASSEQVNTILAYVKENYASKSIAQYLQEVGFSFGDCDITKEGSFFMPTENFSLGNGICKIKNNGEIYELASLEKETAGSFHDCIASVNAGTLFFFENENETIEITIESESMDGRIDKGVYTVTAKEIIGYNKDGSPIYIPYKAVYEVEGSKFVYLRLPSSLDYTTIQVQLGYEGLGASSNHECLCSYSLANLSECPDELTLKMEGYTKVWLGYGVNAEILCDGVSVAKGKG